VAFFLSALVTAPWHAITTAAVAWASPLIGAMYQSHRGSACGRRRRIGRSWRTGCSMYSRRLLMRRSRFRHRPRTSTRRCSASNGSPVAALHRHPQRVGRHHLPARNRAVNDLRACPQTLTHTRPTREARTQESCVPSS
jgi:hypothetical protein